MPKARPSPNLATPIDPDVHAGVVAPAGAEGVGGSALTPAAERLALKLEEGLGGVAEWEAANGALTEAELAAARERVRSFGARRSP